MINKICGKCLYECKKQGNSSFGCEKFVSQECEWWIEKIEDAEENLSELKRKLELKIS